MKTRYLLGAYWKCCKHLPRSILFYLTSIPALLWNRSTCGRLYVCLGLVVLFPAFLLFLSWLVFHWTHRQKKK